MRVALINPHWRFDGSIYFGCRAPHLPIELGVSRRMLEDAGHMVHQDNPKALAEVVSDFFAVQ